MAPPAGDILCLPAGAVLYLYERLVQGAARAGGGLAGDDPGPTAAAEGVGGWVRISRSWVMLV